MNMLRVATKCEKSLRAHADSLGFRFTSFTRRPLRRGQTIFFVNLLQTIFVFTNKSFQLFLAIMYQIFFSLQKTIEMKRRMVFFFCFKTVLKTSKYTDIYNSYFQLYFSGEKLHRNGPKTKTKNCITMKILTEVVKCFPNLIGR